MSRIDVTEIPDEIEQLTETHIRSPSTLNTDQLQRLAEWWYEWDGVSPVYKWVIYSLTDRTVDLSAGAPAGRHRYNATIHKEAAEYTEQIGLKILNTDE